MARKGQLGKEGKDGEERTALRKGREEWRGNEAGKGREGWRGKNSYERKGRMARK